MVKRGLKLFGMGIGTLVILAGIVIGILFAAGVLKVPSKESPSEPSTEEDESKDILHPTKYCGNVPTITSFERVTIFGSMFPKYRVTWSEPIQDQCASSMRWWICQSMTNEKGQGGQTCQTFNLTTGQTYYDLTLDTYDVIVKGDVWLKMIPKNGGGIKEGNKYPYTILPTTR